VILVAGILTAATLALLTAAHATSSTPKYSVLREVNDVVGAPVDVGSIITQGQIKSGLCTFRDDFGVAIRMDSTMTEAPTVSVRIDDKCNVLVKSIELPAPATVG
jgi:hypothetical protein